MVHELLSKVSDPKGYGPLWVAIHKKGMHAITPAQKEEFVKFVEDIIESLLCNNCNKDASLYVKKNPIRPYFNIKDEKTGADIGCFKWSWLFHNYVNRKLGKKEVDWITALVMYSDESKCDQCHKKDDKKNKVKIVGKYP